ncbi:MAG: hypothetical protein GXO12_06715 [Epsilonproteobacteria bacterium]|nr:hypothetical protein [Campylobacterota bacterium]
MGNSMMQKGGKKIKPFLIKKGLPHLTKVIAQAWDDPKLGLSDEQKAKLQEVKKETLSGVKRYSKMVNMIQNRIVSQALSGANPKDLERFVNKLASVKAEATMVHLNCIYKTRNILSKEQYEYVLSLAKKMKADKKAQK